jgi:hypothetical protein
MSGALSPRKPAEPNKQRVSTTQPYEQLTVTVFSGSRGGCLGCDCGYAQGLFPKFSHEPGSRLRDVLTNSAPECGNCHADGEVPEGDDARP